MRRLLVVTVVLALVASGCFVVNPPTPTAGPAAPTIVLDVVTTGLSNPWDIAFTSQGVAFTTERGGDISALVDREKRKMHRPADVRVAGEGGMLGLTVDPQFHNGQSFIYACFASTLGAGGGAAADVRVVRWRFTLAAGLTDRTDIVTGLPYSSGRHSGCRPRFGPDGNLWITTGDAAIGTTPQDLTSLGGKVLRVDRNGAPAAGNPDLTSLDAGARGEIYTYGHRNPQGLAFRPNTNAAYSVEHGPGTNDEVNRLVAGMNAGWNPVPGYNESVPMTDFTLLGTVVGPVWESGSPTIAPSGADFLRWSKWDGWSGALVVAVLKGRQLRVLFLNGAGDVTAQTTLLTELGTRIRSVVHNPTNGDLYVTTDGSDGDGQIWRLTPV